MMPESGRGRQLDLGPIDIIKTILVINKHHHFHAHPTTSFRRSRARPSPSSRELARSASPSQSPHRVSGFRPINTSFLNLIMVNSLSVFTLPEITTLTDFEHASVQDKSQPTFPEEPPSEMTQPKRMGISLLVLATVLALAAGVVGSPIRCTHGATCQALLRGSAFSVIGVLPVAWMGAAMYVTTVRLHFRSDTAPNVQKARLALLIANMVATVWMLAIQLGVFRSLCPSCCGIPCPCCHRVIAALAGM